MNYKEERRGKKSISFAFIKYEKIAKSQNVFFAFTYLSK